MSKPPKKPVPATPSLMKTIHVRGAREHNLKNVDLEIPRDAFVVFTGLSGSGKSSLAFDTIYAEGQRRYVESLSAYARQFLEMMQKPDVDHIDGLSPAISIEQKTTSKNPRSTVGTVTEIYDYLRLLFARVGVPYSPATGLPIESQTVSQMVDRVLALPEGTRLYLLAPIVRGRKGEYKKELAEFMKKGFQRVKINGTFYEIADAPKLDKKFKHDIDVVVDRLVVQRGHRQAPRRQLRDGVGTGRRHRHRRDGRQAAAEGRDRGRQQIQERHARARHLLGALRLPGVGLHHRRDRAAAVLVQRAGRRLPQVRRPRHGAAVRSRARRSRRLAVAQGRRGLSVVEDGRHLALLRADAGSARQALQGLDVDAVGEAAEARAARDPLRLGRRGGRVHLRGRRSPLQDREDRSRASSATSSGAGGKRIPTGCARSCRAIRARIRAKPAAAIA